MVTIEDLKTFGGGRQIEVVNGEIVEHDRFATDNMQHIFIVNRLFKMIDPFVTENQLGEAFSGGITYVLEELDGVVNRARIPDLSFIRASNFAERLGVLGPYLISPTLAVQVTFPRQTVHDLHQRTRDYLDSGVEEVWTVYDKAQEIYRYITDDPNNVKVYRIDDTVVTENLFPGLEIPVKQLFEPEII